MRGATQEVTHPLAHVSDQEVAHVGITCGPGNDLHFFPWQKQGGVHLHCCPPTQH